VRSALLTFALLLAVPATADDAIGPLPAIADIDGWARAERFDVYRGAELYGHINGGSEIYLELGFEHLVVQRYRDGRGREVIAEHYVMDDPVAALGVYMLRCGAREFPNPGLTIRHNLVPEQLVMVEGNTFTAVTNPGGDTSLLPLVAEVGRSIERITPDAPPPTPFDTLPVEGRVPLSERIVRGPFTLQQLGTLGEGDVLQLQGRATGVAARYGEGEARHTLLRVDYPTPEAASEAFARLTTRLDPLHTPLQGTDEVLVWQGYDGRFGDARLEGGRLTLRIGLAAPPVEPS